MKKIKCFCVFLVQSFLCLWFYLPAQNEEITDLTNQLKHAENLKSSDCELAKIVTSLSDQYGILGELSPSLHYGKRAVAHAQKCKDEAVLAEAHNVLGLTYMDMGEYSKSLEHLLAALKLREKNPSSKKSLANALNNVGLVNDYLNRNEIALEYHKRALQIRTELNDTDGVAQSLGNMGVVLKALKRKKEAIQAYRRSVELSYLINDSASSAGPLNNIGQILLDDENYEESIKYYLMAVEINKRYSNQLWLGNNLQNLGQVYLAMKRYKEAEDYLNRAMNVATEIKSKDLISGVNLVMSKVLYSEGRYKESFELRDLAAQQKDSIYFETSARQTAEMQARFESEEKEEQIILLEKDKKIRSEEAKKQRAALWFEGGIILLVVIFSVIVLFTLRTTKRQKTEIERKNAETEKQKQIIEEKQIEILSSIHYAKRIQQALMTNEQYIARVLRKNNKR